MTATLESLVRVEERFIEPEKPIDREKTCPLLLRVFCCIGQHNKAMEYRGGNVPANELQIYTWMDATLSELTGLVKEVNPEARKKGTIFDFSLVTPNVASHGYRFREIGTTVSGQKGSDDMKTLSHLRFNIGDYMDVCIVPPNRINTSLLRGGRMRPY
uniref:Histone deacetylase complex subunit SAP18 n=1 Tax=Clastoptera arizonana TaxID=38151 RepID=A0A1B6CX20_9HEMI